ncbi:MAG: hypothetical protein AB7S38_17825 [Vulcanimicrobiota bacterium]
MTKVLEDPGVEAAKLRDQVKVAAKKLGVADKLLGELSRPEVLASPAKLKAVLEKFSRLEAGLPALDQAMREWSSALDQWRREQERQLPLAFGRQLKEAAEAANLVFRIETSEPPCYRLEPFTVEPHFSKGVARLCYARLALGECPLDPAEILAARARFLESLDKGPEPQVFFERLYTAYRKTLAGAGRRLGERVDLAELLPDLALAMQPSKFFADPVRDNYKPYGRVRLAYDLARLKKAGLLEHQGKRVTLGTATIGTTKKKDQVLYLEGPGGKGQYYLSLAFQEAR